LQRPDLDPLRSKRWALYAWLLAAASVVALALRRRGRGCIAGSATWGSQDRNSPDTGQRRVDPHLHHPSAKPRAGRGERRNVTTSSRKAWTSSPPARPRASARAKGKKSPAISVARSADDRLRQPADRDISVIPRRVGTIKNTASVKGDQKDPVASNNRATATTRVVGPPTTCRGIPTTMVGNGGR
jgi:hypothetical protein